MKAPRYKTHDCWKCRVCVGLRMWGKSCHISRISLALTSIWEKKGSTDLKPVYRWGQLQPTLLVSQMSLLPIVEHYRGVAVSVLHLYWDQPVRSSFLHSVLPSRGSTLSIHNPHSKATEGDKGCTKMNSQPWHSFLSVFTKLLYAQRYWENSLVKKTF